MLSIVLAAVLSVQSQPASPAASPREPRTFQGDAFRWAFIPAAPGGAPGVVKLRCRVRDSGRLIGCRYSEASNHEFASIALRYAHEARIAIDDGGPRGGDYVEFWLRTVDEGGAR